MRLSEEMDTRHSWPGSLQYALAGPTMLRGSGPDVSLAICCRGIWTRGAAQQIDSNREGD